MRLKLGKEHPGKTWRAQLHTRATEAQAVLWPGSANFLCKGKMAKILDFVDHSSLTQ